MEDNLKTKKEKITTYIQNDKLRVNLWNFIFGKKQVNLHNLTVRELVEIAKVYNTKIKETKMDYYIVVACEKMEMVFYTPKERN